jgi:hypothetical protein
MLGRNSVTPVYLILFLINKIYIFFKSQAVILTKLLKETIKRLQGGNPGRHPHRPLPPPPSLLSAAG